MLFDVKVNNGSISNNNDKWIYFEKRVLTLLIPLEYEYKINYINNYQNRLGKKNRNIDIY